MSGEEHTFCQHIILGLVYKQTANAFRQGDI